MSEDRSEAIELAEVNRLADEHLETVLMCARTWLRGGIPAPVIVTALLKAAIEMEDIAGMSAAQISNMLQDAANQLREIAFEEAENSDPRRLN